MSQKIYQIDAFADAFFGKSSSCFSANTLVRCRNNAKNCRRKQLAETAFTVPVENGYEIRWFTPEVEVHLCGHATLASAYTLMNLEGFQGKKSTSFLETAER